MRNSLTYLFLCLCMAASSQVERYWHNMAWKFREAGTKTYYPASVPGTVHSDLIKNHLIPDPYYGTAEQDVKWVEEKDWEYMCDFEYHDEKEFHTTLELYGLDTYARVYLNGKKILQSDNMFLRHSVDVKNYLKRGHNTLKIMIESAVKHSKAEAKKLPYTLPGDEKVFTRKAQYQYGWDWGPRLVTCGIYGPLVVKGWKEFRIKALDHRVKSVTDSLAEVYIVWETESDTSRACQVDLYLSGRNYNRRMDSTIWVKKGIHRDSVLIKIPEPKRWYCNTQGDPDLYQCSLTVIKDVKGVKSSVIRKEMTFGLRRIELIKEKDAYGETFYFRINGKPTFMKGANFIPPDNFMTQIHGGMYYSDLILKAKEANVNMLRVWGGGLYPNEEFYDLCDKNGILVWQDFMFACAMYPGDTAFVKSVKQEAEQQVKRLSRHPCLALWCGNNEIDEGWHNWGWQKQYAYSKTDSATIWNDYQKIFHNILPETVKACDPNTPYISSSPMLGWGKKESLMRGDSHYWGVWWGLEPFDVYEKKVGRFMSEYGFQGMPGYFTLKKYGDSLDLNSAYIKAHQKHPTGYQTINTYMARDYTVPTDFFNYVYTSQLLQRDGMQIAIEAHRRHKPYCMGSLYWQWNDCWPVTSWSAIDYDHQPKALYYATKKLYANFCLSVDSSGGSYKVYVISDSTKSVNARLEVRLKNTRGETLLTKIRNIPVKENSSEIVEQFSDEELKPFNRNEIYLSCHLLINEKTMAGKNYFFVKPKDLVLHKPAIRISQTNKSIKIESDVFVKDFYLYSKGKELDLPDNYMDIEPNQPVEIKIYPRPQLPEQIQYLSLYDITH